MFLFSTQTLPVCTPQTPFQFALTPSSVFFLQKPAEMGALGALLASFRPVTYRGTYVPLTAPIGNYPPILPSSPRITKSASTLGLISEEADEEEDQDQGQAVSGHVNDNRDGNVSDNKGGHVDSGHVNDVNDANVHVDHVDDHVGDHVDDHVDNVSGHVIGHVSAHVDDVNVSVDDHVDDHVDVDHVIDTRDHEVDREIEKVVEEEEKS